MANNTQTEYVGAFYRNLDLDTLRDATISTPRSASTSTSQLNGNRTYGPILGNEVIKSFGFYGRGVTTGSITTTFGLFLAANVTNGDDATPIGVPLATGSLVFDRDANGPAEGTNMSFDFSSNVGNFVTVGMSSTADVTIVMDDNFASMAASVDLTGIGGAWAQNFTQAADFAMWIEIEVPKTVETPSTVAGPIFF